MKKITKTLIAILLIAVMSMTHVVAFAADEGISPRLSHTSDGGFSFAAVDNVGYIGVTYYGYDSFVRADLNVKIQKRFLLVNDTKNRANIRSIIEVCCQSAIVFCLFLVVF